MGTVVSTQKNNAKLVDLQPYIQAGINPKTGLPVKMEGGSTSCISKGDIKRQLRIVDEQDAVNRFTWYNLPKGLNAHLIERILYYRGQGMLFKMQDNFYFLPYALDGTIDCYGRYNSVTPLPFTGTTTTKEEKPWIPGMLRNPVYDIQLPEDFMDKEMPAIESFLEESCVILKDYTEQYSQTNIARQQLQDPLLDVMSDCIPFMRTALLNSTGLSGVRVQTEDEYSNVLAANYAINAAALNGEKFIPITGTVEFQEISGGAVQRAEDFLLALQSLDNYRLSLYGLDNGGLFQKRSHMLEAEQEMNSGNAGLILQDSLYNRQMFCLIANSIWGTSIWVEASETALGIDRNMDGQIATEESTAAAPSQEPQTQEVTEDERNV